MKNWKIIIEQDGKTETVTIMADSYADAYVKTGVKYPRGTIMSITQIREN